MSGHFSLVCYVISKKLYIVFCMKQTRFFSILAFCALVFTACDSGSSSGTDDAEDSEYGKQRYEKHYEGDGASADCYVYVKGNLYSVLMRQDFGFMGKVTVLSQVTIQSPMVMRDEVGFFGTLDADVRTDYCDQETELYQDRLGGTVTCTKDRIIAEAVIEDVEQDDLNESRRGAVSRLSDSCDDFIHGFRMSMMSEE